LITCRYSIVINFIFCFYVFLFGLAPSIASALAYFDDQEPFVYMVLVVKTFQPESGPWWGFFFARRPPT
jgi:hypothetical protein